MAPNTAMKPPVPAACRFLVFPDTGGDVPVKDLPKKMPPLVRSSKNERKLMKACELIRSGLICSGLMLLIKHS